MWELTTTRQMIHKPAYLAGLSLLSGMDAARGVLREMWRLAGKDMARIDHWRDQQQRVIVISPLASLGSRSWLIRKSTGRLRLLARRAHEPKQIETMR